MAEATASARKAPQPSRLRIGRRYRPGRLQGPYDAVVIGSGMGGLTTAALLSAAGKKVLVLEQHYTAGGFTHAYDRNGYEWDVGVHYIGDVGDHPTVTKKLFDFLTAGNLHWAPMDNCYDRICIGDEQFDLCAGREQFAAEILKHFPGEEKTIEAYLQRVSVAGKAMRLLAMEKLLPQWCSPLLALWKKFTWPDYLNKTTYEALRELTDNEKLIAVLTGQWGDNGMTPQTGSFIMHALIARHYLYGGYYPVGGASKIAETIIPQIQKGGGEVFTYAKVETILLDGKRVRGVRMADGTEIAAPLVISAAGVFNTFERLLPRSASEQAGYCRDLRRVRPSMAHLCLYIGLRKTAAELGLPKTNYWLYPGTDYEGAVREFTADSEAEIPLVYISFPSAKDPSFNQRYPGRATIEIVAPAKYEWFQQWHDKPWGKRGEDYEALKEKFSQRLLEHLYKHFPQLRGQIDYCELSTPLSTDYFCCYSRGEIYGLEHDPARFKESWLRPQTRIKGLYLTGQDILICGVTGAMIGGVVTAQSVLGWRRGLGIMRRIMAAPRERVRELPAD
ncbi:NAD(P)/FAD-dependent oxidoreductase [Microbulbifer thermotolerans]|uniref:NAD(P)/FAD-dependent oxidoreductase n=1 Tax=Microbulbifer thermotolerans TaxID=252514 RepID=A0AB35HZ13_MICTH|nr:NAD(P)/FAD-dependent oxidoreductase [Microbulbifer thermotolerans]MCX2796214.1 NAD(P)/FAD-dependent oxidoreductase [Microbulbifer thermotolerans]MCX2802555.1 NAD(P)/FAD-dependent oxidoreductase [Microbulbifer thermotolerans]MCX2842985.1 NAD(P)/FAD-dependent oxidoreductase [Microbulbifer thermotolerans]WKT60267.1 NAD(P)/FAD-dependent oxidoreductase [Microbulbifer thermotolerans]